MELRTKLGAAALLAAAAMATAAGCGGRDDDGNTPTPDAGCTGVCSTDAGTDAGTNTDAGVDAGVDAGTDAGTLNQIAAVRKQQFTTKASVRNVVVSGIHYEKLSDQGNGAWRSYFWVTDPAAPKEGIFVHKFYSDTPDSYHPQIGDVLDIEGFFGTEPNYEPFTGRRHHLANQQKPTAIPLAITVKTAGGGAANAPPANEVTVEDLQASLAAPQNGSTYLGTRVHLAGPLTLTNAQPTQLQRLDSANSGTMHYGFEVTGGILVYHDKTRSRTLSDGGTVVGCDYQKAALDGGAVTFPNGISGVWDTYTFAPCTDGGTDITGCGSNNADSGVPGIDDKRYTYTIIPQNCADLPGQVDGVAFP